MRTLREAPHGRPALQGWGLLTCFAFGLGHNDAWDVLVNLREARQDILETVTMPNDLMGLVEGRSSLARVGLSVHLTAPKIDPGFGGMIALEIANAGPATVRLESQKDWPEG